MLKWEAHVILWIRAILLSCKDMHSFIDRLFKKFAPV